MTLDDLELELRKLPGVHSAGFEERDDVLLIQLHAGSERGDQPLPVAASRIAARHSDRPVAVEVVRWRNPPEVHPTPAVVPEAGGTGTAGAEGASRAGDGEGDGEEESHRPRLLAVLAFPDTDEVEVHLILDGRRTIGRAPGSRGLVGVAEATIEALSGFGADFDPKPRWARPLEPNGADEGTVLIAVAIDDDTIARYGLAAGASSIDATARATLDAVNRRMTYLLAREL
ncbi:MAG: hypothetical protein QOI55_1471 [Actinomycetota bacterium]|jgi:hypothetical protein|nr:hypothetical protein [Actinomycetota bacterium]